MSSAYHAEQRGRLWHTVDDEICVENFVTTVFRIRLRKHHQFHVGRIALQRLILRVKIIDFVVR